MSSATWEKCVWLILPNILRIRGMAAMVSMSHETLTPLWSLALSCRSPSALDLKSDAKHFFFFSLGCILCFQVKIFTGHEAAVQGCFLVPYHGAGPFFSGLCVVTIWTIEIDALIVFWRLFLRFNGMPVGFFISLKEMIEWEKCSILYILWNFNNSLSSKTVRPGQTLPRSKFSRTY